MVILNVKSNLHFFSLLSVSRILKISELLLFLIESWKNILWGFCCFCWFHNENGYMKKSSKDSIILNMTLLSMLQKEAWGSQRATFQPSICYPNAKQIAFFSENPQQFLIWLFFMMLCVCSDSPLPWYSLYISLYSILNEKKEREKFVVIKYILFY